MQILFVKYGLSPESAQELAITGLVNISVEGFDEDNGGLLYIYFEEIKLAYWLANEIDGATHLPINSVPAVVVEGCPSQDKYNTKLEEILAQLKEKFNLIEHS